MSTASNSDFNIDNIARAVRNLITLFTPDVLSFAAHTTPVLDHYVDLLAIHVRNPNLTYAVELFHTHSKLQFRFQLDMKLGRHIPADTDCDHIRMWAAKLTAAATQQLSREIEDHAVEAIGIFGKSVNTSAIAEFQQRYRLDIPDTVPADQVLKIVCTLSV